MPDGVSISPNVETLQARSNTEPRRGSRYRSNPARVQSFYARGRATGARKNPAGVRAPTGSIFVATTGIPLRGVPVSWLSLSSRHPRTGSHDATDHTNRF